MICTQGKVIPDLIAWWCERDGVRPDKSRNRKGSTWVMSYRRAIWSPPTTSAAPWPPRNMPAGRRASVDELRSKPMFDWLADVRQGYPIGARWSARVVESVPSGGDAYVLKHIVHD